MKDIFFKKTSSNPRIYVYSDVTYSDWLKVGYTTRSVEERVKEQYPTKRPGKNPWKIELDVSALRKDSTAFLDKDVLRLLEKNGYERKDEWVKCNLTNIEAALHSIKENKLYDFKRHLNFKLRIEQRIAIQKTIDYFKSYKADRNKKSPHFLWNAKMRFGKTFAAYKLAEKMNWKKILVLTFKPAVQSAWEEDVLNHTDFKGWKFLTNKEKFPKKIDNTVIYFGSFQDFLGKNKSGGIKSKNEYVHTINWDCVIFDEYHYGAWRENAKELFEQEDKSEIKEQLGDGVDYFKEEYLPITTKHYLYLSGTPFRAITSGEFIEEQIYNWTYTDEQKLKNQYKGSKNPYEAMPKMIMMTYDLPESIKSVASKGEFDQFDLNIFFSTKKEKNEPVFIYKNEVQRWLNFIRGYELSSIIDDLKQKSDKAILPYRDTLLLNTLSHTLWFLPRVDACHAMKNLLEENQNNFYHDHKIICAAGKKAGVGIKALEPVRKAIQDPFNTKSITLTCGKLLTGVTVKPWSGIFMLRNLSSPETYFQAAFRTQSSWEIFNPDNKSPNKNEIIKKTCYIFDFAPNRALKQIADYSCRLNAKEDNPEKKVNEFIKFLPILAYEGISMKQLNAEGILDMSMSGTTATLLARRWESASLVNVDDETLSRILKNEKAMNALMKIEGFRNINKDVETILNKSEHIKKMKNDANKKDLNKNEKRKLSEKEKEYKSLRDKIQKKLIKFSTRIPVFMYLTDYRERSLEDIILKLEPNLFTKVTGLNIQEFELLVSLNVFNREKMNDAVYKFKRYEDSSLSYAGIYKHQDQPIGLYDTTIEKF